MALSRRTDQSLLLFCCLACLCLLTEAIDCRRFVFAPMCRGVSAKRSTKLSSDELRELGDGDESWMDWPRSSPEDSDPTFRSRRGSSKLLRELLEKYHDYLPEEEK